jgi:hypothetical protein
MFISAEQPYMRMLFFILGFLLADSVHAFAKPDWCSNGKKQSIAEYTACQDEHLSAQFIKLDEQWRKFKASHHEGQVKFCRTLLTTWNKNYFQTCQETKTCLYAALDLVLNNRCFKPSFNQLTYTSTPAPSDIYRATASQLYVDYQANRDALFQKINNRQVVVTGWMSSFDIDKLSGNILVWLNTGSSVDLCFAMKDSELHAPSLLLKQQMEITLRCEKIISVLYSPDGVGCVFQD